MTDAANEQTDRGEGSTHRRWLVLAFALVGLVYVVGMAFVGGPDALDAVRDAAWLPLFAAFLLQVLVTLLWPLVHRASLRAVGEDLPYPQVLQVSMSVFTVSHTVPVGGAVGAAVGVRLFSQFGVPGPAATGSAALTGPVSLTTIAGLGAAGIAAAVVAGDLEGGALGFALAFVLVLLILVGAIVAGLHSPRLGERVISRIGRLHHRLEPHVADWRRSWVIVTEQAPGWTRIGRIFAWSTLKWSADIASLGFVFVALGAEPTLTVLLVGFGVSQALATIPSTPGGVGLVEGGMVGALVALGISAGLAVTIALLYRMLQTWLPALAGIPVLLRRT